MSDIRYVAVGQQRFDAEGNREGTIIGSYHWPERVAEAGLTGEWLELILIPASRQDRDWSMLEAAQESIREKDAEIARLRAELEPLDEQEPVAYTTPYALEAGEANIIVAKDVPDANKSRMIPLYRHPPAPAAVPLAHADLYEAIHEACATMPEPVSDDDGDTQADHIYSAVRPFVADAEPASRSESEIKAEALEGVAEDIAATIGESRWGAIGVQGLRNRAARLRGEGSD